MKKIHLLVTAVLLAVVFSFSAFAEGWQGSYETGWRYQFDDGRYAGPGWWYDYYTYNWGDPNTEWYYFDENHYMVTNCWRKSGDYWFYMGSDGSAQKDLTIWYKENLYYVNIDGAMLTNEWVPIDNNGQSVMVYFGPDGKAVNGSEALSGKKADASFR